MKLSATDRQRILDSATRAASRYDTPGKIVVAVTKNLGLPAAVVREVINQPVLTGNPAPAPAAPAAPSTPKKSGRGIGALSVEALIENERLDAYQIARKALTDELGSDQTIHDEDLRRHCEISKEDWKDLRDDERLATWRVRIRKTRKVIWCGAQAKRKLTALDSIVAD